MAFYIVNTLKSRYCKIVFLVSLILSSFLIPDSVFYGYYVFLAFAFMIVFSLTIMCLVKVFKENLKNTKISGIGGITAIIGVFALQVCGVGAPACGASLGFGILSVLGVSSISFLSSIAIYIVLVSIIVQFISLYYMNCFKTSNTKCKGVLCLE